MRINIPNGKVQKQDSFLKDTSKSLVSTDGKRPKPSVLRDQVLISGKEEDEAEQKLGYLDFIKQQEALAQETRNKMEEAKRELEASKKQIEAKNDEMDTYLKCLKIAMRILAGDKVPARDMKFLLDNDSKLYTQAILMKKKKEDPKEHKALTKDEEDTGEIRGVATEGTVSAEGTESVEAESE